MGDLRMYTLLIADDEPLIRNGVKKIIDWESLGFSEIFLAEDGQEALDIIRKNHVDLVLTDIVMPFMDGLELSEILSKEFPDIHVVILTGHEDFEYAQKSVGLGVKNYILKPIGAESLYKKMVQICEKLHIENKQRQYVSSMKSQLRQSMPALREQTLNKIVCSEGRDIRLYLERAKSMNINLMEGIFEIGVLDFDLENIPFSDYDLYLFAAKNIARECLGDAHYIFEDGKDRIVILFRATTLDEEIHEVFYDTLCVIQKAIFNTIQLKTTCAVGTPAHSARELNSAYRSAKKALECKYSLGSDAVYDIADLNYLEKSFHYPVEEMHSLIKGIKIGNQKQIREAINSAFNKGGSLSGKNVKLIYIEIVTSLLKELSALKEVSEKIWKWGFELYQDFEWFSSVRDLEEELYRFACEICEQMNSVQTNSAMQVIDRVKEFVMKNYKDPELSLSTAAEYASVSTGYLSGLFKKESGTNFVKYLTDVRMEKCMHLLRTTDMKTYEIAYETGFSNPHYFSISFKKYTGMSPSEFRAKE